MFQSKNEDDNYELCNIYFLLGNILIVLCKTAPLVLQQLIDLSFLYIIFLLWLYSYFTIFSFNLMKMCFDVNCYGGIIHKRFTVS